MPLCECGCGQECNRRFVRGHSFRAKKSEIDVVQEEVKEEVKEEAKIEEKNMATDVLELNRQNKVWVCSECKKEYEKIPGQCSCGALARSFDEKDVLIQEGAKRSKYLVERNVLFAGQQINKGEIVSLVEDDRSTKEMLRDKIISPIKKE